MIEGGDRNPKTEAENVFESKTESTSEEYQAIVSAKSGSVIDKSWDVETVSHRERRAKKGRPVG